MSGDATIDADPVGGAAGRAALLAAAGEDLAAMLRADGQVPAAALVGAAVAALRRADDAVRAATTALADPQHTTGDTAAAPHAGR